MYVNGAMGKSNFFTTFVQVCFLPGTLALGATKGITKEKAMRDNLLNFEDLENLKLAEDLAKTCFEMYAVTSTGLAPEIAYFHTEVSWICMTYVLEALINELSIYAHQMGYYTIILLHFFFFFFL